MLQSLITVLIPYRTRPARDTAAHLPLSPLTGRACGRPRPSAASMAARPCDGRESLEHRTPRAQLPPTVPGWHWRAAGGVVADALPTRAPTHVPLTHTRTARMPRSVGRATRPAALSRPPAPHGARPWGARRAHCGSLPRQETRRHAGRRQHSLPRSCAAAANTHPRQRWCARTIGRNHRKHRLPLSRSRPRAVRRP